MTEAEMEPYAKQLEQAVDLIVGDREFMIEMQDLSNVPIEVVGRFATDILSAELYRHLSKVKPKVPLPANVPPASLPRPLPQNDNGVRSAPRPPPPPPRMTPAPVYKPKKAALNPRREIALPRSRQTLTTMPEPLLFPEFLYGELSPTQRKMKAEAQKWGKRYAKSGDFPEPKLIPVPPGSVVLWQEYAVQFMMCSLTSIPCR